MNKIIEILRKASDCYYNSSEYYEMSDSEVETVINTLGIPCQSLMTDAMYDEIYYRAKELYPTDVFFISVGSEVRGEKVDLPIPLGSMTECKSGEIESWLLPNIQYVISEKLDGNSCLLVYENGKLKIAYSRGDGHRGQDITRHVKTIKNELPEIVKDKDGNLFTGMIRGEIIIPRNEIVSSINELKETTGKTYRNGRNSIAGLLNAKDTNPIFGKYARFIAYMIDGYNDLTEQQRFNKIKELGFTTPDFWVLSNNTEGTLVSLVKNVKQYGRFECDGIIVTQDVIQTGYEGFETSTLNPKCSRKFKVGATDIYGESRLKNIIWQVSKWGSLRPVGIIEPIDIQGVTIERVSLNNMEFILDKNIRIGCKCKIMRAGSVIPYWVETLD